MYFVYIIRCKGDTLYTGITTDVRRRFRQHSGEEPNGAKFTHSHPPEAVEALWSCENRSLALKLEHAIKKLRREQKLRLIGDDSLFPELFGSETAELYTREEISDLRVEC